MTPPSAQGLMTRAASLEEHSRNAPKDTPAAMVVGELEAAAHLVAASGIVAALDRLTAAMTAPCENTYSSSIPDHPGGGHTWIRVQCKRRHGHAGYCR